MVFSVRTLFLFIRGIDQTGRAMESASGGIKQLISDEKALAQMSHRLLFAGAAFLTFGVMAAKALGGIVEQTERGSMYMSAFGNAIDRFKTALADAIIERHGERLESLLSTLESLGGKDWLFNIIADVSILVAEFLTEAGGAIVLGALGSRIMLAIAGALKALGFKSVAPAFIGGAALLQLSIGAIITIVIGKILWERFAPESWKEKVKELSIPLEYRRKIGNEVFSRFGISQYTPAGFDIMAGSGYLAAQGIHQGVRNIINNITFENVETGMETEELLENIGWILNDQYKNEP
jgi:hypothetical protein